MDRPYVSLVMAAYNGLPYIEAALTGIRRQTYTEFEAIIVDDASTDGTWDQLQAASANDERFSLIRNERNLGVANSRNLAIERARGALIACHDADDISRPERLARQVEFLSAHPEVGFLATHPEYIDAQGNPIPENTLYPTDNESLQHQLLVANCFCAGSVMIRHSLLAQTGLYHQDLAPSEDYDLWLRLAELTQLAILPVRLYQYRQHTASASNTRRLLQMENKAIALERALRRRHGGVVPDKHHEILAQDYVRCAYIAFAAGDSPRARKHYETAVSYAPLAPNLERITASVVERYTRPQSASTAHLVVDALFAGLLPRTPEFERVRQRLLAQVHLRGVYEAAEQHQLAEMCRHVWAGARNDPRTLFAPGLISFVVRRLLGRSDKIRMTVGAKRG